MGLSQHSTGFCSAILPRPEATQQQQQQQQELRLIILRLQPVLRQC
jgi:hypothetical protein